MVEENNISNCNIPVSFEQIPYNDYMTWYTTSTKSTVDWSLNTDEIVNGLMDKLNPRTGEKYTMEEATDISNILKDRAFGKGRFNVFKLGKDSSASTISSVVDLKADPVVPKLIETVEKDGKTEWRYHLKVAGDGMLGRNGRGELKGYTRKAHELGARKFIGAPVVVNHDGDFEGGLIFDSWLDENGDMNQVFHIYNETFKKMVESGFSPSIRTMPTKTDGHNIHEYEALHTSLLFPGAKPGFEAGGLVKVLESKVGETDLKEEKVMETETYTKEQLDEAIKSSVGEMEKKFQAEIQELKLSTVKSSISSEHGTKDETLDLIAGGGVKALEAFSSSISELKELAKKTVVSQKSVAADDVEEPTTKDEDETKDAVVSTIENTADAVVIEPELEITKEDKERYEDMMKRVSY